MVVLFPEKGKGYALCQLHRVLSKIYHPKGEIMEVIHHFETALRTGTPFNWHDQLFWVRHNMASLFRDEDEFEDNRTS